MLDLIKSKPRNIVSLLIIFSLIIVKYGFRKKYKLKLILKDIFNLTVKVIVNNNFYNLNLFNKKKLNQDGTDKEKQYADKYMEHITEYMIVKFQ